MQLMVVMTLTRACSPLKTIVAPGDENRLSFGRSVDQVLKIVTLGGMGNKGGFFPDGLNGCLK
jgi:hypothetical protein